MPMDERRKFSRTPSRHFVIYSDEDGVRRQNGRLVDVSLGGLCLEGVGSVRKSVRCHIDIRMNGTDPTLRIPLSGVVAHSDGIKVGIELERFSQEVLSSLKSLVLEQAPNPDQIMDELRRHVDDLVVS